jgi:hypothetical protein
MRNVSLQDGMCLLSPPGFFDSHSPAALQQENIEVTNTLGDRFDNILTADNRHDKQQTGMRCNQEGALYDELEETRPIAVDNGSVTFCWHFKYFGSFVSFSLCDDLDIKNWVTAATQSMGVLKKVWNLPHLDI